MVEATIRSSGIDDLEAIMTIMEAAFEPRYGEAWNRSQVAGIIGMPGCKLYLAETASLPVGFALTRTILEECELMLLGVLPNTRRQGVGRALLAYVMDEARNAGARKLYLEARLGNKGSALYLSAGLGKIGSRPKYYRGNDGQVFDAETYGCVLC